MSETRWIVELLLPDGAFEARSIVTERTVEELDADARSSVAELLAWKPPAPPESPTTTRRGHTTYETHSPLQSHLQSRRRLLMAHCADPAVAQKIAADLSALFPALVLPWTEGMKIEFLEFMQGVFHGNVKSDA